MNMENREKEKNQGIKVLSSEELFGGSKEVHIRHGETVYRLLITRQGKLILNK